MQQNDGIPRIGVPSGRQEAAGRETTPLHGGWMLSSAVAARLGIATSTLKKWRQLGKGPEGWRQTTRTTVHYQVTEVLRFENTWGRDINEVN